VATRIFYKVVDFHTAMADVFSREMVAWSGRDTGASGVAGSPAPPSPGPISLHPPGGRDDLGKKAMSAHRGRCLIPPRGLGCAVRRQRVPAGPAHGGGSRGERALLRCVLGLAIVGVTLSPASAPAHPLGNFSISQYTSIRISPERIELRYVVDLAEIPTYQEIQATRIVPEVGHPSVEAYLARKLDTLKEGLFLEVDGRRLGLRVESSEVIFPPGAGGMPTMKLGAVFQAKLPEPTAPGARRLTYRDGNFPDRAGWKEIVAVGERGITIRESSVPEKDRSQELSDYPTNLLNRPPQVLEAKLAFGGAQALAEDQSGPSRSGASPGNTQVPAHSGGDAIPGSDQPPGPSGAGVAFGGTDAAGPESGGTLGLRANKQGTPRDAFTQLMTAKELPFSFVVFALAVAAGLGAAHALEPGHGKTIVAAYLVGSRGTAWHAVLLGLIVTFSHTAGVFLLGVVTLFASRYIVPEHLYPWLGVVSGLAIAVLGFTLFLRRYAGQAHDHAHSHTHADDHPHHPHGHADQLHSPNPDYGTASPHHHHHHSPEPGEAVSFPALLALGVTGGMVPCPAALVVLLTAVSLHRIGFGLILIVAFSVGLAAVLIAVGMLMVSARRLLARLQTEGPLIQRWLPLTSSVLITILGLAIAVQALVTAGIIQIRV